MFTFVCHFVVLKQHSIVTLEVLNILKGPFLLTL